MQADTRTKERVSRRGCRFFPTKPSFIQRDDTISLRKSRASRSTDAGLMSVENSFKRKERLVLKSVRTYVRMYIRVYVSLCVYLRMYAFVHSYNNRRNKNISYDLLVIPCWYIAKRKRR